MQLHIHHRFYIKNRQAWEYDNDVFQVLCSDCHEKVHKKNKIEIPLSDEESWLIDLARKAMLIDDNNLMYINNIIYEYLKLYPESEFFENVFMSTLNGDFDKIVAEATYMGKIFATENDFYSRFKTIEAELEQLKTKKNG